MGTTRWRGISEEAWEKWVLLFIDCIKDREGIFNSYVLEASVKLVNVGLMKEEVLRMAPSFWYIR